jgi:hypothetical protein
MTSQEADELTIPGILARAARRHGDATAIEDGSLTLSFSGLEAASIEAAAGFVAAGLGRGDRVGIWAPNQAAWIVAAIGAQTVGAAIIPLNTRLKGREAGDILRRSRARALFTVGEFLGTRYPELLEAEALPDLALTVLLDAATMPETGPRPANGGLAGFPGSRPRHPEPRAAQAARGASRPGPRRHHVHLGHDRPAEGRDVGARAERPRLYRVERVRRALHAATGTSSSTRSSTPLATRRAGSPA